MVEIADLWKSFGSLAVLKGVSLRVERGSVVAIIGPSGSGKSTLLRCLNLLEEPDRGNIRVGVRERRFGDGLRSKPGDRELSAFRAATGMVFQHFNLFPHMTVIANVMSGPSIVIPSLASCSITPRTSPTSSGSSAEVTSSSSMTAGFIAKARAIATRCRCPPESCAG